MKIHRPSQRAQRSFSGAHLNPPGLPAISYRLGDYGSLLALLAARLAHLHAAGETASGAALGSALWDRDLALALLKAWAVVGDVLCFYQERIANEGFLRTALERRSVVELVRQIGYELAPGVAAQTYVAFTVIPAGGNASVKIPAGAAVQSLPVPGDVNPPLTFETTDKLEARVEWNSVAAFLPPTQELVQPRAGACEAILAGVPAAVRAGEPVLIVEAVSGTAYARLVSAVTAWPKLGATLIEWETPLPPAAELAGASLFRFARSAALFGSAAPLWPPLKDAVKKDYGTPRGGVFSSADGGADWLAPRLGGLTADVRALAVAADGTVFAGTAEGVFRSSDEGQHWELASAGLAARDVHSLAPSRDGSLWAGATTGVFFSGDAGHTWVLVRPTHQSLFAYLHLPGRSSTGQLPLGVVRALAVAARPPRRFGWPKLRPSYLFAALDAGVFRSRSANPAWDPWNRGLPGYDRKTGQAKLSGAVLQATETGDVYLASAKGVFRRRCDAWLRRWKQVQPGPVRRLLHRLRQFFRRLLHRPPLPDQNLPADLKIIGLASARPHPSRVDELFAADAHRLFRANSRTGVWQELVLPEAAKGLTIAALAVGVDPALGTSRLYVGTDRGVLVSNDLGESWLAIAPLRPEAPAPAVQALAAQGERVWVGTLFDGFVESEWPGFHPAREGVDLDKVYPRVAGGWVALADESPARLKAWRVQRVEVAERNDFRLNRLVTRFVVAPDDDLPLFHLRTARAYFETTALELFERDAPLDGAVRGASVQLAGVIRGLRSGQFVSVSGERVRAAVVAPPGGVWQVEKGRALPIGFRGRSALALLAPDGDSALCAAMEEGVWAQKEDGWMPLGHGRERFGVLLRDAAGAICAGSPHGVYRWENGAWNCFGLATRAIHALCLDGGRRLCAGTSDGAYRWDGADWEILGLEGETVRALVCDAAGQLWAGTPRGVRRQEPRGWVQAGLAEEDVHALCPGAQGWVWAGNTRGVWVLPPQQPWRRCPGPDLRVSKLVPAPGNTVFAATRGTGVWQWDGDNWTRVPLGLAHDIADLASDAAGILWAAARAVVVLREPGGSRQAVWTPRVLRQVDGNLRRPLAFGLLTPALTDALKEAGVSLDPAARLIAAPGRKAWVLAEPAKANVLVDIDGALTLYADELLTVMAPVEVSSRDSLEQWTLRTGSDFVGTFQSVPGELMPFALPAPAKDGGGSDSTKQAPPSPAVRETVSEVARLESAAVSPDFLSTELVLAHPLVAVYAAATVRVCANVVPATHGESVPFELLGSGDGTQANQSFTLRKSPLTYVPADTATGLQSTLQVRVRNRPRTVHPGYDLLRAQEEIGVVWTEVERLAGQTPFARVYTVHHSAEGADTITFGDGVNGARLPTGADNVTASYRSGSGAEGNLAAGRLALLRTRLPGLRNVVNPVPASGGAAPEPVDTARERAPLHSSSIGRLIAFADYERFARTFAGVGQAYVRRIRGGGREWVAVAVSTATDRPVTPAGPLLENLGAALRGLAARPVPLWLGTFTPIMFHLSVHLVVAADFDVAAVQAQVAEELAQRYGARYAIGHSLARSDLTALLQALPGILVVEVRQFFREGSAAACADCLQAASFAWDEKDGTLRPPERLQLSPDHPTGVSAATAR